MASRLLAAEELVAVLPLQHLAGIRRLALEQLEDQPLVDFQAGSGARRQTDEAFAAAGCVIGCSSRWAVSA